MSNRKKANQSRRHDAMTAEHHSNDPAAEHLVHATAEDHPEWANERAAERSRQQSLAARDRDRATRTQLSAGQTKVQRLHRGNQPRGA